MSFGAFNIPRKSYLEGENLGFSLQRALWGWLNCFLDIKMNIYKRVNL